MRIKIFGLLLLSLPALAQDVSFRNDREGQSYFYNARKINRALRDFKPEEIVSAYHNSLKGVDAQKVCAYDINASVSAELLGKSPRFDEIEGAFIFLRHWNELDDVALKILLDARKVSELRVEAKDPQSLRTPKREEMNQMIPVLSTFKEKIKTQCFDDAYRSLLSDLRKKGEATDVELEGLFVEAQKRKSIDAATYLMLERARAGGVANSNLTLKTYLQKRKSLRLHKPLRDPNERSEFVTQKVSKTQVSQRIKLFAEYSDLQIMLMADVIRRLRTRLEAKKVTISIYGEAEEDVEIITLQPMERFRLAIKLLRREMTLLSQNTYFNGRTPGYLDLISASYETSLIPAVELKELGGLEEIWNPKKTFWEKASVWIRTFSSVATIAIPQPYGFIPALVLVVIEATVGKGSDKPQDDTVLF